MNKITQTPKLSFISAILVATLTGCVETIVTGDSVTADPERALESQILLGEGYLRNGDRAKARIHFDRALEYDKRSPGALNGLAVIYQLEAEPDKAEDYFKRALRADKNFSQARNNYALFLYGQRRFEDAYEEFEIVSKDLTYDRRPSVLVNFGRTALELDRPEKAEVVFERALSLEPGLLSAIIELAELKFTRQDYAAAKNLLDRYGQLSEQSSRSLWLGIRIERIFGNKDKEASYALALRNLHPYSKEYLEYKKMTEGE